MIIVTRIGFGKTHSHRNHHETLICTMFDRKSDCQAQLVAKADKWRLPEIPRVEFATHKWALKDISRFHLESIQQAFEKYADSMNDNDLFVGFIQGTYQSVGEDITFTSAHIRMLLVSAENGFAPAQAVINRVFQSYNIEWPPEYAKKRLYWLSRGTEAGCMIARLDLMNIDNGLAQNATATFLKKAHFGNIIRHRWMVRNGQKPKLKAGLIHSIRRRTLASGQAVLMLLPDSLPAMEPMQTLGYIQYLKPKLTYPTVKSSMWPA